MKWDLGVTTAKRKGEFDYRSLRLRDDVLRDFIIVALTPGIPTEWVNNVFNIQRLGKRAALRKVVWKRRAELEPLALENAATITVEDGFRMLWAIRRKDRWAGPIPYWGQLALAEMRREKSLEKIAKELGIKRRRCYYWADKHIWDPLTLQRLTSSSVARHYRAEHAVGMPHGAMTNLMTDPIGGRFKD